MSFLPRKTSCRSFGTPLFFSFEHQGLRLPRRCFSVMASRTYGDAVTLLNTLQTPYAVLKKRRDAGIRINSNVNRDTRKCLERIGYSQEDLSKLNIVHVAGTKGKGSTCAYVDSILHQWGKSHDTPKNIGLFTSPHLIAVRERIRINSSPISRELFAKYFFEIWDKLEAAADVLEKPVYFRYLTLLSFHVFIQEKVDVAIYEVGVGGEYDSTNIVDHPAVTGISTLGIDHTFTLGETVDKIAWHKAGILKRDVPAFTVKQVSEAMEVVEKRAEERGVKSLTVVERDKRLDEVKIRPDAPFQRGNVGLAVKLAETALQKIDPRFEPSKDALPKEFVDGLEQVVWRGRCEKKVEGDVTWYLDGAHTADSIVVAAKWFGDEVSKRPGIRVLIFNQQGDREAVELLSGLYNAIKTQTTIHFDHVIFCPTVPVTSSTSSKDFVNLSTDAAALASLTMQKLFVEKWAELEGSEPISKIQVLPSVEDAFEYVRGLKVGKEAGKEAGGSDEIHVLITGSVHLVGRALGALEGADAL